LPLERLSSLRYAGLTRRFSDHPDVQEKVRRAVTQGHLDPEDFKGVRLPCRYNVNRC